MAAASDQIEPAAMILCARTKFKRPALYIGSRAALNLCDRSHNLTEEFAMPYKRRGPPKARDGQITPQAIELFAEGLRLRRREDWSDAIRDNAVALAIALGQKPWHPDVFHCDDGTPPDHMNTDLEVSDYARSRAIRLELEAALRDRRRAARMARRVAKAAVAVN